MSLALCQAVIFRKERHPAVKADPGREVALQVEVVARHKGHLLRRAPP